jgi:hypothetical protein
MLKQGGPERHLVDAAMAGDAADASATWMME